MILTVQTKDELRIVEVTDMVWNLSTHSVDFRDKQTGEWEWISPVEQWALDEYSEGELFKLSAWSSTE